MSVYITLLTDNVNLSEAFSRELTETLERLLEEYNLAGGEVGVILTDDQYLNALHKKYKNKDKPTDVLSFCYLEPVSEHNDGIREFAVGDIYVSVERAFEQADQAGHSREKELFLLAVHGMLHLLGYDHNEEKEKLLMHQKERELIKKYSGL